MKVELNIITPIAIALAGVIYGYGVLNDKVDKIDGLDKLSDDNMNDIIVLKTQMNMLISPSMEIRPSKKVEFHEIRINQLEKDIYKE